MNRDADSFDRLYRDLGDPWDYETSAYEADKYARCLQLLPRPHYHCAVEIGCSIGVMSAAIAQKCDSLLGLDFAPTAIAQAQGRGIPNARFRLAAVPQDWPQQLWDLIVLSEVIYYLEHDALDRFVRCVARDLAPGGDCLVVGYTGDTDTEISSADASARLLDALATVHPDHVITCTKGSSWIATVFSSRPDQSV